MADHNFAVWRMDDNGMEVEMARFATREKAEIYAESFRIRGHKQFYWVRSLVESRLTNDQQAPSPPASDFG